MFIPTCTRGAPLPRIGLVHHGEDFLIVLSMRPVVPPLNTLQRIPLFPVVGGGIGAPCCTKTLQHHLVAVVLTAPSQQHFHIPAYVIRPLRAITGRSPLWPHLHTGQHIQHLSGICEAYMASLMVGARLTSLSFVPNSGGSFPASFCPLK